MKKLLKKTEGFTLVELIVVIAILGILAGVGTVGYSGYVEKANKQADISLASQVANALALNYYANPGSEPGYVTLTKDGATASNDNMEKAMVAAFGASWDAVSLKYSKWAADGGYENLGGSALANTDANKITGAVTGLTNLAAAVIGSNQQNAANIIGNMFGEDGAAIADELRQYEGDEKYETIASNLLVKYFAEDIGSSNIYVDDNNDLQVEGMDGMSSVAATYAAIFAMANSNSEYSAAAQAKLDAFNADLEEIAKREQEDSSTEVQALIFGAVGELLSDTTVDETTGKTFGEAYDAYTNANEGAEMKAIIDAMGLVDTISNGFSKESLSDPQMFNSDSMVGLLQNYQTAANSKGIVVFIDEKGNTNSLPAVLNAAE